MSQTGSVGLDKGRYLRGMVWSVLANCVGIGAGLVTIMVAARLMAKEELGAYFLVMAIAAVTNVLGNWGLINTSIRYLSTEEGAERDKLANAFVAIRFLFALVVAGLLLLALPLIVRIWPYEDFTAIAWQGVLLAFLMLVYQMGLALLSAYRLFGVMAKTTVVVEALRMVIAVGLLLLGGGASALLWGLIVSRAGGMIVILAMLPFKIQPDFRHSRIREILGFGTWLQGSAVVSTITSRAADALITTYLGTESLAVYSTALQIPAMLNRLFEATRPVVLGYVSALQVSATSAAVVSVRLLTAGLCLGCGLLMVLAEPVLRLVYSAEYVVGAEITRILCCWSVIGLVNYYLSLTLTGMGKVRGKLICACLQCVIMIVGCVMLVPRYGGVGAACSLVFAAVVGHVVQVWLVSGVDMSAFGRLSWAFLRSGILLAMLYTTVQLTGPSVAESVGLWVMFALSLFLLRSLTLADIVVLRRHAFQRH